MGNGVEKGVAETKLLARKSLQTEGLSTATHAYVP
jgi:hypothetical protein